MFTRSTKLVFCTAMMSTAMLSSTLAMAEEEAAKLWSGEIEFGYANATGNTNESSTKSRASADRESENWRYNIFYESLNSETDGERSAEKYFISNRLAYMFSPVNYAFGYASYDDDRFNGFDYQATVAAGYGRRLLNNNKMKWDVEVGPGYRIIKVEDGSTEEDSESVIVRASSKYAWKFSDSATFGQTIEVVSGSDNTTTRSLTSLSAQIVGELALKLSYLVKYNDTVPTGTDHADTETIVTLSYKF